MNIDFYFPQNSSMASTAPDNKAYRQKKVEESIIEPEQISLAQHMFKGHLWFYKWR